MDHSKTRDKIESTIAPAVSRIKSRFSGNTRNKLLLLFLVVVLFTAFIIPCLDFGRLYGTDDYSHLFHTQRMAATTSMTSFYENMKNEVSNSDTDINPFNYPFGLWLYGSVIIKLSGLSPITAIFLFTMLFFFLLVAMFYFYAGAFLATTEQRLIATLFFISMPNLALSVLSYRPSMFILPFLFLIVYIAYRDPLNWKLLPIMLISIFIIVISHTGTCIFLLCFTIVYFLLYCLIWGKFSRVYYIAILSTLVIYIISLNWFPQISNQYEVKSSLFLTIANFLTSKINVIPLGDLGRVFYENLMVGQQFVYAIIFGAIIFTLGKIFLYVHRHAAAFFSKSKYTFPALIPVQNISHSVAATPFWIGPLQTLFSVFGAFHLDNRGKCILLSALICTLLPDWFNTTQGIFADTGALREVSYLVIIIPITAALGFCVVLKYLHDHPIRHKKIVSGIIWFLVLSVVIITPTLATTYYLPRIAGENYIIDGMKWLGQTGSPEEKVAGYGYRTVPIYTNMTDSSYGLQSGSETRSFTRLLKGIYFTPGEQNANEFVSRFGTRYLISSDKILANLGNTRQNATIDNNTAVNKVYSSNDFGIYEIATSSGSRISNQYLGDNISLERSGASLTIQTSKYLVILDETTPTIERIGTPQKNILGEGFFRENVRISGSGKEVDLNQYSLDSLNFTREISGNKIIYHATLLGKQNTTASAVASLTVVYHFYQDMIEREYLISNDWDDRGDSPKKSVSLSTDIFTGMSDFVSINDQGRQERHIYESEDAIIKNDKITSLYVHKGDEGIFIKYGTTSPYPTSLIYKGSTIYNMSSISVSQSNQINPGASLHTIQYLSIGDEESAEQNILNHAGVILSNYPNGKTPVIITGYRTPMTDLLDSGSIENGYAILKISDISYSEAVLPVAQQEAINTTLDTSNNSGLLSDLVLGQTPQQIPSINLQGIASLGIPLIGVQSSGTRTLDDHDTQEKNIVSLFEYANGQDVKLTGFMPVSLNYNLDTLEILREHQIPFVLAVPVNPPIKGIYDQGFRNPEVAYYHNELTGMVLLPVSYPMSSSLVYQPNPEDVFSSWKTIIDQAAKNDEMVLFVWRANDIGNPAYSDEFTNLMAYAREKGLVFTTAKSVADHYLALQDIVYEGTIDNDMATILVHNINSKPATGVTFKVLLPVLKSGDYKVENAQITQVTRQGDKEWVSVTTDLDGLRQTKILIAPEADRENLSVVVPSPVIEGPISLGVRTREGAGLRNAEVSVDDLKHYRTDKDGNVQFDARRGIHTVEIEIPGYNSVYLTLDVKGRLFFLSDLLKTR